MPEAVRSDPGKSKTTSASGRRDARPRFSVADGVSLTKQDPEMAYVWAAGVQHMMGVGYYQAVGYEVVTPEPHGVKPLGVAYRPGLDRWEWMGLVLMQISKDWRADLDANGADGESGQKLTDQLEQLILNKEKHDHDPTRGIVASRYAQVKNTGEMPIVKPEE